jgi:hypothetical protein
MYETTERVTDLILNGYAPAADHRPREREQAEQQKASIPWGSAAGRRDLGMDLEPCYPGTIIAFKPRASSIQRPTTKRRLSIFLSKTFCWRARRMYLLNKYFSKLNFMFFYYLKHK